MTLKDFLDKYGPTLAVLGVLVLLVVAMPRSGGGDDGSGVDLGVDGAGSSAGSGPSDGSTGPDSDGGSAVTGAGPDVAAGGSAPSGRTRRAATGLSTEAAAAEASATAGVRFGAGPNCRPDGRQDQIWLYAPVCVEPWKKGADNGGATDRGVTADKVVIARFLPQQDPATEAILRGIGAEDTRAEQRRIYEVLRQYMNAHNETYGREVVVVEVDASGPNDNDEAMKADAARIAGEIKAFAVFGQTLPPVFAAELAHRGVPCVCVRSQSKGYYAAAPPMIFGDLPTIEDYYDHLAEYIGERLAGKPAKWADDPAGLMQREPRKFGLLWVEGERSRADPNLKQARDYFVDLLRRKYGVSLVADVGYQYQPERAGDQATTMIARMKQAGVSNLLLMTDPLYPIFITKEATRQAYFPEWLMSGTLLTDTTFFGRTYDQQQWRNAFGMSPLWVFFKEVSNSYGYRMYHHMRPGAPPGEEGVGINVYASPIQTVFNMIQMAGPNLTVQSFVRAVFNYPRTGGIPAAPLVYYTRESPNAIKDYTEVWWNENGRGKDETGKDGVGILMKANGGRRYQLGDWPPTEPNVFDPNGAVFTTDDPPGGKDTYPHEADGHTHDPAKRCMSC